LVPLFAVLAAIASPRFVQRPTSALSWRYAPFAFNLKIPIGLFRHAQTIVIHSPERPSEIV